MSDNEVSATRRRRTVIALGSVERPLDPAIAGMWRIWSERPDTPTDDLAPPAALALGRMADRMRASDPRRYEITRDRLLAELRAERDATRTVVLLKALGNAPDPSLTSSVVPFLTAYDALVRAAAADTLGLFGGTEAVHRMTARLIEEPTGWVRQKLGESLLAIPQLPADALGIPMRQLATESHVGARLALARLVARSVGTDRDARVALEQLLALETDEAIRDVATRALAPTPSSGGR